MQKGPRSLRQFWPKVASKYTVWCDFCWLQRICRSMARRAFLRCFFCHAPMVHHATSTLQQPQVQVGVSKNGGTPKSSILIGFLIINHPFWGTPIFIFGNTQVLLQQPLRRSCQEDYSKEEWMQDTTGLFEGAGRETINSPHCLDVRRVWSGKNGGKNGYDYPGNPLGKESWWLNH